MRGVSDPFPIQLDQLNSTLLPSSVVEVLKKVLYSYIICWLHEWWTVSASRARIRVRWGWPSQSQHLCSPEWQNVHAPPLPVKSKTIARRQWSRTAKHLGCDRVA